MKRVRGAESPETGLAECTTATELITAETVRQPLSAETRQDIYIIAALLAAAAVLRLYSLQFYHVIATDGTSYALTARAVANGDWHGVGTYGLYPILIAVANWIIPDLERAGRVVSIVGGSFLVIPLYLLGKTLFTRNIAIAACLLGMVWPTLVSSSCEVITQATHTTLQLASVYCIWRSFMKPTLRSGSLAGLLMGLSYLTRPEAILLSVALPAVLLVFSLRELREKRLFFWSYGGSFLLLFALNMLLVHHVTGEWQLSAKTDSALNDALSYYLNKPDLNYILGYEPKGYLDIVREHPAFLWKNSIQNIRELWNTMLPLPLWFLFIAGFLAGGFGREENRTRLFLLATFAPLPVIILFYYVTSGYVEAYMPVMFLYAAAGVAAIEDKLKRVLPDNLHAAGSPFLGKVPLVLLAAAIYAATVFAPQIRKDISDAEYRPEMDNGRRTEKHLGLMLKNNLLPGKIMTRWARIAFYAERDWVNVPADVGFDEVIKYARDNGVRYLVADAMLYNMRPKLGREIFTPLMDKTAPAGLYFFDAQGPKIRGLRPDLIYNDPEGVGLIVYEIPP